ncbi:MAG: FliO/MopB family protein [Proteobacteria bacterium]|nr:FliO/MopB family protein [Pseudomonadota bacterium]
MEPKQILLVAASLALVLGLVWVFAQVSRRLGFGLPVARRGAAGRRLAVVDSAPIDGKRRLVLVRRDHVEHLLVLGPTGELVVEAGIASQPALPRAGASDPTEGRA